MAKKKYAGKKRADVRIRGTASNPIITVAGAAPNWTVTVSVELTPGAGESAHSVQGSLPKAIILANGVNKGFVSLTNGGGVTWSGAGPINSATKPNEAKIEYRFIGPLTTATYPIPSP